MSCAEKGCLFPDAFSHPWRPEERVCRLHAEMFSVSEKLAQQYNDAPQVILPHLRERPRTDTLEQEAEKRKARKEAHAKTQKTYRKRQREREREQRNRAAMAEMKRRIEEGFWERRQRREAARARDRERKQPNQIASIVSLPK